MLLLIEDRKILFKDKNLIDFFDEWNNSSKFINLESSATTGRSKIIKAKKKHLIQSAKKTGNLLNLKPYDSAICCLPVKYIAGKMMIIRSLVLNLKLYYINPSSHPIEKLNKNIDFCAMNSIQAANSINKISLIKNLLIGGGIISKKIQNKLFSFKNNIYEVFSMTETYSHFAVKKISQYTKSNYFKLLKGFSIKKDQRNCLIIKTPYFNRPIITNDIVKIKNNNLFRFLGRFDFLINSGGIKLCPEEIERKIYEYFDINYVFIISSIFDDKLGEKLILIIESDHINDLTKKNLIKMFQKKLSKYEVPKDILTIKKFKRTNTGKIIRKNLI